MTHPAELIELLGLAPHPEGGWYAETHRHIPEDGGRGAVTHIHYLLEVGQHSRWHRVNDATEIWHHVQGGPLELLLSTDGRTVQCIVLGTDYRAGQCSHAVVPPGVWQAARPISGWSLSGCTVAPAFEFSSWELAPEDFSPEGAG
jgi:predicted cupin superfamily sugar epimerase